MEVEDDDGYYEDLANLYNMASAMSVAGKSSWQPPKRPQQLPNALAATQSPRATVQTGSSRYSCVDNEDYYEDLVALYTMASTIQIEESRANGTDSKKNSPPKIRKLVRGSKRVKPVRSDSVSKRAPAVVTVEFPILSRYMGHTIGDSLLMITDDPVSGLDLFSSAVSIGDDITVSKYLNNPVNKYFLRRFDSSGKTALHIAVKQQHWSVLDLLLREPTLCIDALSKESGLSALHCIFQFIEGKEK